MKTTSLFPFGVKALLLTATLSALLPPAVAQWAGPQITSIHSAQSNVVVTVEVPAGLRRVTLESRTHLQIGAWEPRAVQRLDGAGGRITFSLPATADLQLMRVRANEHDPLPESFYRGSNTFENRVRLAQNLDGSATAPATAPFAGSSLLSPAPPGPLVGRAIVESDIWKLRGNTLYYFNHYRGLQVIDLTNADAPVIRGVFSLPAAGEQMYLLDEHYVVLLARKDCNWNAVESEVVLVDTSPSLSAPTVVTTLPVPGRIIESRLVGTALYVAAEAWRPQTNSSGVQWEQGTHVLSFDLANPEEPLARSALWFPSGGSVIAATDRFLFVALRPAGNNATDIHCLDISAFDGVVQPRGSVRVAGEVADKFKMHLNGDVFSVISWGVNSNSITVTKLETFSLAQPASPARLGHLEFAANEQLFATRFDGNRLYAVTYRRIDPLWVIDLSNPAAPSISGELRIPGWSTYIQPWGERLVTVGIDDVNGNRVAAQLFDVSDPAHPSLLSKVSLGENSSWSEATQDEKAVQILPEAGLILLPYQGWLTNGQAMRVQLIDLATNTLTARGFIDHEFQPRRATVHGQRIYSISPRELLGVDATNRDQPQVRSRLELSWRVDQVFVHGDYVLELNKSDAEIRVVRSSAPDVVLAAYTLPDEWPVVGATVRDGKLYLAQRENRNSWDGQFVVRLFSWWDASQNNTASLKLSILDLAALPALSILGSTDTTNGPPRFSGEFEALWPKPGLLVWSGGNSYSPWVYSRPIVPALNPIVFPRPILIGTTATPGDIAFANAVPGSSGPGVVRFDSLVVGWPINHASERWLVAFDVESAAAPKFISSVNLGTNGGWNFSKAHEAAGLIYLSHQLNDRVVKETNYHISTITRVVTHTNRIAVTNLTAEYSYTLVTNTIQRTNVTETVRRTWPAGTRFSAGLYHTLALQPDGKVFGWGANSHGQLGDGTYSNRTASLPVAGVNGASFAAGGFHNLVLQSDGTVAAWGQSIFGQLGHNPVPPPSSGPPPLPTISIPTPVILSGFPPLATLVAGDSHSLALTSDGTVLSWGANWNGQLGDGTTTNRFTPVPVSGLGNVTTLAAGSRHNLAIVEGGSVVSWGRNDYGQLGNGNRTDRWIPGAVSNLSEVVAAAGGLRHSLALKADGSVWSWGADEFQQNVSLVPRPVPGLSNVTAITAGRAHSVALCADGSVWAWGQNELGQLGAGVASSREPQRVIGINGAAAINAGAYHSVAATSDGTTFAWGDNRFGQLGQGEALFMTNVLALTQVATLTNTTYVTYVTWLETIQQRYETVLVTNVSHLVEWVERHYLDVVDYADPAHPTPRQPVNIPRQLAGLSHEGALLYTLAMREEGNTSARYLDASAYDDVSVWLVDSMRLPGDGSHPVLAAGTNIFVTRPATTNVAAQIEAWTLAESTGRFTLRDSAALPDTAHSLFDFRKMLAVQTASDVILLETRTLDRLGAGKLPACAGGDVDRGAGDTMRGLWIPLNDYGIQHVPIDP